MLGTGGPWVGQETTGILGAADRMPKYRSLVRLSCLLPLQQAQGVECVSLPLFDSLGHGVGPLYPQGSEVTNSKSRDVYKLPPPTAPGPPGDTCRSRIPSPLQPETQGAPDDEPSQPEPSPSTLIYLNRQCWKCIHQRWKEASHRNQLRYSESMKILREMYERQ